MKRITFSLTMICSLILTLGIGLFHVFSEHEENFSHVKNETHFHLERSDCNDVHFFSQTLGEFTLDPASWDLIQSFELHSVKTEFLLIKTTLPVITERGPPVINSFKVLNTFYRIENSFI